MNKKNVLVVDDDKNFRTLLSEKFKISGFNVFEATNGKEGLEKALESHPDIILLDILMPIMNGWDMLKTLRESGQWGKEVKIVMLTGVQGAGSVAKAIQDGSFVYLVKTEQSIDSIVTKIEAMLKTD